MPSTRRLTNADTREWARVASSSQLPASTVTLRASATSSTARYMAPEKGLLTSSRIKPMLDVLRSPRRRLLAVWSGW
jgi:hypothetical protein